MTTPLQRIGFMQGRLSALVDGKIQAFPWGEWREIRNRFNELRVGLTETQAKESSPEQDAEPGEVSHDGCVPWINRAVDLVRPHAGQIT